MHKNSEKEDNLRRESLIPNLILLSIIVVLIGVVAISFIRSNSNRLFPSIMISSEKDIDDWSIAVKNNNQIRAILLAKKIVSDAVPKLPQGDYIQLFLDLNISTLIVTSPFNKFDFFRWRDAFLIDSIVNPLVENNNTPDDQEVIINLFNNMMNRIIINKSVLLDYKSALTLHDIWNKKTASRDELCRLFAAIGLEDGYDVAIISIFSKERQLLHKYCELRKNQRLLIADPQFNFIYEVKNPKTTSTNIKEIPQQWPADIANCAFRKFYEYPAEFADYKTINTKLYNTLKKSSTNAIPLFGQSPSRKIDQYIEKYSNKKENTSFSYWTFPFNSLKCSSAFPKLWRLQKKIKK